ncbi:MAG TPA: hypothetical protein VMR37_02350, partial [Rhabdochlamydiaceae bacterium]|nr:hypothetical protein [Rhabdochlamydiaceae bacterium]
MFRRALKSKYLHALFCFSAAVQTSTLFSAQYTVNSTSDNPATVGSLRNAINQANNTAGTNTILIDLPSGSTITLSSFGLPPIGLNITSITTTNPVAINGGSALQAFFIKPNASVQLGGNIQLQQTASIGGTGGEGSGSGGGALGGGGGLFVGTGA